MAIIPAKGYKIDPTNPNAVVKDTSSLAMPGSINAINSQNIQQTNPVSINKPVDNTNYAGILAGAQQQALNIQQQIAQLNQPAPKQEATTGSTTIQDYLSAIQSIKQPSATQTYSDLYGKSGLQEQKNVVNEKAAITAEAQGRLNNISAQLQALNIEAQTIPVQIQQESEGRGRTAGGVASLQADALRANALKALPLQAQAAVIQAEVATAQGNQKLAQDLYTQAQDHFDRMFTLQLQDAQNQYESQTNLINQLFSFADKQQQRQLQALRDQADMDFKTRQDELDYQREANLIRLRQNATPQQTAIPQTFEEQISDLKLSTGQKSDLVDIQTLEDQLNTLQGYASDGVLEGIGSLGQGALKSAAFTIFGTGSKEGADVRTLIGNLKGQIAKLRGGTSFTANEEKLLNSYVPGINESTESVLAKVRGLQDFLASKKNAIIKVGGGTTTSNNDPLGIL